MNWCIKTFSELSGTEVYELLKLRSAIFVVEQKCIFLDMDDYDFNMDHILGYEEDKLIAYCRVSGPGVIYTEGTIGRVVTDTNSRIKGIGHQLMKQAVELFDRKYPYDANRIMAQYHLTPFYAQYGFVMKGDAFWEDRILHNYMVRPPAINNIEINK